MICIVTEFITMKYNNENMLQKWYWTEHYIMMYNWADTHTKQQLLTFGVTREELPEC
jgi:hypothetical protein